MAMTPEERKAVEIAHGRQIAEQADTVWQLDTPASQQRLKNRYQDIAQFLGPNFRGRLLELGSGTGTWTEQLAQLNTEIIGIELTDALIKVARSRFPSGRVTFIQGDCENIAQPDASFDCVCGRSILHHLDVPRVLSESFRVLKPGGKLWFSEPNMMNPQIMLQKNIPILKKWAGDTPDETAFFRWPLQRQLVAAGFTNIDIRPIDFLHPTIPAPLVSLADRASQYLEKTPLLREIGGSLSIRAEKGLS